MTATVFPWGELGIGQTSDVGAIRRAYSARLKQIDADEDTESFIRLREAYDHARAEAVGNASAPDAQAGQAEPVAEPQTPAPSRHEGGAPTVAPPPYDPQPFQRIGEILFEERSPAPGDEVELRELTERILADPRMELIEHARDIEGWLAEVIANGDHRADAMLAPAVAWFGWGCDSSRWDEHPIIVHLAERHKGAEMIARLTQPDSAFHRAFLELTSARGRLGAGGAREGNVLDLINMIRADAPYAEAYLDKERLNEWIDRINARAKTAQRREERTFQFQEFAIFGGIAALLLVPRMCALNTQSPSPPPMISSSPSSDLIPSPQTAPFPAAPIPPPPEAEYAPPDDSDGARLERFEDATRRNGAASGMSPEERKRILRAIKLERERLKARQQ